MLDVDKQDFWYERVLDTLVKGRELHTIIYDIDYARWREIQNSTAQVLKATIRYKDRILDAGCGYGAILDEGIDKEYDYYGMDLSPILIDMGKRRYPRIKDRLLVGDLRVTPFENKFFDWSVCRSFKDMYALYKKDDTWMQIQEELIRISNNILFINYDNVHLYEIMKCH